MATRNIVPRANEEGNIGTNLKRWLKGWFKDVFVGQYLTDGTNQVTVADIAGSSLFGSSYQKAESLTESSTTNTSYQQKLRLTTPSLPAGNYRIGVSFQWAMNSVSSSVSVRGQIDDATTMFEQVGEAGDTTDYLLASFFGDFTLGAGVHNIDLDYLAEANTAYIKNAKIEIWRVS